MMAQVATVGDSAPPYAISASPGFAAWLHTHTLALAVTTYQIGKLFLIGSPEPDRLSVTERTFQRCLGVAHEGGSLYLAGLNAITRFENVVPAGQHLDGHDAVFSPRVSWFTGDVFAHDVGVLPGGRPVFINTLFSCLATVGEAMSFHPVWWPGFVTALRPEDRCHLNGLAMEAGRPRFVTAAGTGDTARSWREQREGGGAVIDIASGEIVAGGLTMPHSPRLHDGRLFLCEAGTGTFGEIDLASGRFNPIAACRGFARGLALAAGHALVGLSLPRQHRDFSGLPLDGRLRNAGEKPVCRVEVIHIDSGRTVEWLALGGVVRELYDVAVIPGLRAPMAVGFAAEHINRLIHRGALLPLDRLLASTWRVPAEGDAAAIGNDREGT